MGASSSRASWPAAREQETCSRWCRCFDEPARYGTYARTDSVDSQRRRRRRRHRSTSVSSAERIDDALERRGRTRQRRGSAPQWEVVLEVLRPDGGYTRLPRFILSTVRRTAQAQQPAAVCGKACVAARHSRLAVLSHSRCLRCASRRVNRIPSVVLLAAPPPSTHTSAQRLVNTAFSP